MVVYVVYSVEPSPREGWVLLHLEPVDWGEATTVTVPTSDQATLYPVGTHVFLMPIPLVGSGQPG